MVVCGQPVNPVSIGLKDRSSLKLDSVSVRCAFLTFCGSLCIECKAPAQRRCWYEYVVKQTGRQVFTVRTRPLHWRRSRCAALLCTDNDGKRGNHEADVPPSAASRTG